MKTNKYILILMALLFWQAGTAQAKSISGLEIINSKAEVKGDSLYVNIDMSIQKVKMKAQEALLLTPVVQAGQQVQELPAVMISGKRKFKAYKRSQAYGAEPMAFVSMRSGKEENAVVNYSYAIPFQPWMETANVALKEEIYGCVNCQKMVAWVPLLDNIDLPIQVQPMMITYVTPPVEKVKNRDMSGQAFLDFPVGKSNILPDFRRNPTELAKIQSVVEQVKNNRYATITSIDLTGYASPEGSAQLNLNLSKNRALALKTYLQDKYGYKNDMFNVQWKGEDWDGLRKLVEASDLTDKVALLEIINSTDKDAVKDRKIATYQKGVPYKTLLSEYYPKLRRTEYKLNYTVRAFSVAEGIEILKVSPAQMSLNEMFLVANTYPKGSKDFNEVFDIAVRVFPQDPIANINAGATSLSRGDLQSAHRFLDNLTNVPQAWNSLGIMYFMEGNYDKAGQYFNKAMSVNPQEAQFNLEQLNNQMKLDRLRNK